MALYHDGIVHHPLGAGSYYFGQTLVKYLSTQCLHSKVTIHVGTQPNSSPHLGNLTTFATTFSLASALQRQTRREVRVKLVFVDTAPAVGQDLTIDGIQYQRTLKQTGQLDKNRAAFTTIFDKLSKLSQIPYSSGDQNEWRSQAAFPSILWDIIERREAIGKHLAPETGCLAMRAPCPMPDCGLCDKHGIRTRYESARIIFSCPEHGAYTINRNSKKELQTLGFNTPLRNLLRILLCSEDEKSSWIFMTGGDYAGFYQEQFLWRLLDKPAATPIIMYAPLILDWSGAKLSKSLYVKEKAYHYLQEQQLAWVVNFEAFIALEDGIEALYLEAQEWVLQPFRLFRSYTVDHMDRQIKEQIRRSREKR